MNPAGTSVREHDFAPILSGPRELTAEVEDALFDAGCDDATLSVVYGCISMEFSRVAPSLKDAIWPPLEILIQAV